MASRKEATGIVFFILLFLCHSLPTTCQGGACAPHAAKSDGTSCNKTSDLDNSCTVAECRSGQCQIVAVSDGTTCDDSTAETINDACNAGEF